MSNEESLPTETKTPRSDAEACRMVEYKGDCDCNYYVPVELSRKLELELAEANKKIRFLIRHLGTDLHEFNHQIEVLNRYLKLGSRMKESLETSRWFPIGAAPKDGTEILLLDINHDIYFGHWDKKLKGWRARGFSQPVNPELWKPLINEDDDK